MKCLITGMTAQQANPASHTRVANYSGFVREVLQEGGHDVDWGDPLIDHDLAEYDYVIVGVAPITSLGANRTYGALSIIERLWDSDKLTLLLDAPEPQKVSNALTAIVEKPDNFTKPFYSYRKEYEQASQPETRERLFKAVEWLHAQAWPRTLVPALPWHTAPELLPQLPAGARANARLGDLEVFVMEHFEAETASPLTRDRWAVEPGSDKRWLRRQATEWPMDEIPWSSREHADRAAMELIHNSSGTLIAPQRTGTWWSSRYGMSLAQGVPVFSDWRETQVLGNGWHHLPTVYECVDQDTREFIARSQIDQYMHAIGTKAEVVSWFERNIISNVERTGA